MDLDQIGADRVDGDEVCSDDESAEGPHVPRMPGRAAVALSARCVTHRQPPFRAHEAVRHDVDNERIAVVIVVLVRIVNRAIEVLHTQRHAGEAVVFQYGHADQGVHLLGDDARKARPDTPAAFDLALVTASDRFGISAQTPNAAHRPVELESGLTEFHVEPIPDDDVLGGHAGSAQTRDDRVDNGRLGGEAQGVDLDADPIFGFEELPPGRGRIRSLCEPLHRRVEQLAQEFAVLNRPTAL